MKVPLVALSLVLLGLAAVPAATASHGYCFSSEPVCCQTGPHGGGGAVGLATDVVMHGFIAGCRAADATLGYAYTVEAIVLDYVDCVANGNC